MQKISKSYQAAVYLRLSREDGDVADGGKQVSNSIANQKELVFDYLKSHPEIEVVSTYTDDGYSGVNFERPDFQRMLSDIREAKINCVIVKDLSRFGRNYIESGRYIEKIFPMLGVRFIAITDGYDSINEDMGTDMIIPFKNLINDAYCRDISIKIRSHMDIKRKNGEYIGAFAAYGYLKDEENKNHLVVDEYAADVVRDIFAMKLCGMSQQTIADKLNSDGILSPIQYKKSIGIGLESSFQKAVKPKWSYNAVLRILKNEVYTGTVVQGKCTTPNYKIKKRIHKDESEWIRVENTHEAIIPKSEFDLVQSLLLRDTRVSPAKSEVFPLAGMVFCADCGEPMVRKTITSNGKKYIYYVCSGNKKDKKHCWSHSISEKKLNGSVLELVKTFVGKAMALSEAIEAVNQTAGMKPDIVKYENRILKLREEAETCGMRKKNLYEDFKDGILTREEYSMLRNQYQKQIDDIEESIASMEKERDCILTNGSGRQEWIEKLSTFNGITCLDRNLITFLIERIDVIDGNTLQVTYRFQNEITELENVAGILECDLKEAM
ncbi:recombinase family protein [Coprococcus phoceensis]|uniref:recombinase family protein n=1 Tax=Coprococcus phoceensis TaxID=1870993 RepID=UPI003569BA20